MINTWVVTGDCHGDMKRFSYYSYPRDGSTGIIILGDAGVNYYMNRRDFSVKRKLQKTGYQFYLVRGNHEARPEGCDGIKWDYDENVKGEIGIDTKYPAIHYLRDGNTYTIGGYKCLVIGGAYSVDKYYRIEKGYPYQWFPDEQLSDKERKEIFDKVKGKSFDFVFTHTCPRAWEPFDLFLPILNQDEVDKSMEEWLDDLKSVIKYKIWLFGHFHASRIEKWYVEQYYEKADTLDNIWERWNNPDGPFAKEWWLQKSPNFEL